MSAAASPDQSTTTRAPEAGGDERRESARSVANPHRVRID
jgi:hypothetical protein